ncbi:T9SS type A sorting domain-containing protein [candidate division TA06 bacterium]|uniref:T9SS type A sorting domain-containing protein n=1 Tax=candidate division TA06 bacterium TaxID=2250710 RepID=A0A933MIS3_UNCT6|nr:T9SS type A sorting domain-containing protein [candidate division TA06 bacterium]
MKKNIFMVLALIGLASSVWAAIPSITLTTIWPDTAFSGPYTVRTVIKCSDGLGWVGMGFYFNPDAGSDPLTWPYGGAGNPNDSWIEEYTQSGDTFYFDIPAIPADSMETPVKVGYCILAYNASFAESSVDPSSGYHSFLNKIYTPAYSNVSALKDTFFNGPFVVKTRLNTAYGDSVKDDFIYSDIAGGFNYPRDSVGADGYYYYSIPRFTGNAMTPVKVLWFLTAYDTLGNWAQWPVRRDTMNWFNLIDPMPSNPRTLANTDQTGPFPVWATFKGEGPIINDSLWIYNGGAGNWDPYARDSLKGDVYYYTIPQQQQAVINPINVQWYLKASDSLTGNYTYLPFSASIGVPYEFRIFDWTGPVITNLTQIGNTSSTGPFDVTASCRDTSGIAQVRVYFRAKPSADTSWNYLPMYPTGNPDEYQASLPVQSPGMLVQYYVSARDGALNADGTALWNVSYAPAGGPATPNNFYTGSPQYKLLLVNDGLVATNFGDYYTACLDSNGVTFGYWDNRKANGLTQLRNFNTLIWFTGDDSAGTLIQSERDSLTAFLNRGGNLLLSSKNLGQSLGGKPNSDTVDFYHNYLKVSFDSFNIPVSITAFIGNPGLPISHGIMDTLSIATLGTAGNWKSIDRVLPLAGADSLFTAKTIGGCGVVICSTGVYKSVYSSIPLEAVSKTSAGKLSRTAFIGRCLNWFGIQTFYKVEGEEVSEAGPVHDAALLYQAYPNPFGQITNIKYQIAKSGQVSLKVYNVLGQMVRTLVDEDKKMGSYEVVWNGRDETGNKVSNGIYLYRLVANDQSQTKKVVVLR